MERIYIGGLDPERLRVEEVLGRVPDSVQIESISRPAVNPCYCHLSASTTIDPPHNDDAHQQSALSILQQLLHNVKWKGCKLQVQPARPHFLERLRAERQARNRPAHSTFTPQTDNLQDNQPTQVTNRRFFRIRPAYGKPAVPVDSQPYQVSTPKVFAKMVQHVRKRKLVHVLDEQQQHQKRKPYRAVHWRFDGEQLLGNASEEGAMEQTVPSTTGTSDDDDDDDDDDSVSSDEDLKTTKETRPTRQEKSSQESDVSIEQPRPSKTGTYVWSDDESSSSRSSGSSSEQDSDDSPPNKSATPQAFIKPQDNSFDEFATGWNDTDDSDDGGIYNPDVSGQTGAEEPMIDMQQDESRNLKILAGLFPEVAEATGTTNAPDERPKQEGWNDSGQMMRYDPTKASSKQLEQTVNNKDEATSSESEGSETSLDKDHGSVDGSENDNGHGTARKINDVEGHVYRQDDLEHVFREAREAQASRPVPVVDDAVDVKVGNGIGGFSFGFSLEQSSPPAFSQASTFSFNFDEPKQQTGESMPVIHTEEALQEPSTDPPRKRRKMQSSYDDLDRYVNAYLNELNDGQQIAANLNAFRNDPHVQEDWESQRRRLTADWKSKRKHAITRRKK